MKDLVRGGALLALLVLAFFPIGLQAQQVNGVTPGTGIPVRKAWTSDRHALQQGDLVTILIDEYILASANKNQLATQERSRDLGVSAGAGSGGGSFGLQTNNDVGDRQRGESSRQQRFSGEISARVVEVNASGMVRIQGTKKLQIDEVEEEVTIRGWVRPQDLSLQNTVESWRLSDAEILYSSNGTLGEQKGFWTRLINKIWP
jgi:flagellar L-ring protein precursor FlgH